nr:hypothetical protein [Tanacetum cinerariifolium]
VLGIEVEAVVGFAVAALLALRVLAGVQQVGFAVPAVVAAPVAGRAIKKQADADGAGAAAFPVFRQQRLVGIEARPQEKYNSPTEFWPQSQAAIPRKIENQPDGPRLHGPAAQSALWAGRVRGVCFHCPRRESPGRAPGAKPGPERKLAAVAEPAVLRGGAYS